MKICSKCKREKELNEFSDRKDSKDGKRGQCKECELINKKVYYQKRAEKIKEHKKQRYQLNKPTILAKCKNYYKKNKEKIIKDVSLWQKTNPDKRSKIARKYYENTIEQREEYGKNYYQSNKERMRPIRNDYQKRRKANDPLYKLAFTVREKTCKALRNGHKAIKTMELLGCTVEQLKEHIQSQFQKGMTWENWAHKGWHIDHIIPISSFDLSKEDEQRICFHYTNLQPLWAEENLKKSNKIDYYKENVKGA